MSMDKIRLLDCTLRDGGYINGWNFGYKTIKSMIARLAEAGTDIIEAGFLRNVPYDPDKTLFNSVREAKNVLPEEKKHSVFALMALHNQYSVEKLEENDGTVDIIRVTFHNYDMDEGLDFCRRVKEKGYRLFVNPINIMGYTDGQLLELFEKVNKLGPYGFSIVDTFGSMTKAELMRIYSLCEKNLDREMVFGLHLHENLALSFSLAQSYLELRRDARRSVLDASLNGMGRVPGNLSIELIMDFLNRNYQADYDIDYVLDAIEEHILPIKKTETWGYQTEYFLSAKYNLHRNYAEYFQGKGNLTTKEIKYLLRKIPEEKKSVFDEAFAEALYQSHENRKVSDEESLLKLKGIFGGRKTVLLAPGKSLLEYWPAVRAWIERENALVVTANFFFDEWREGYAFFSNGRRFQEYKSLWKNTGRVICTSNVAGAGEMADYVINYERLAVPRQEKDANCGVMLVRLMSLLGVLEVFLAGFDGFSEDEDNYMPGYFGSFASARCGNNRRIAAQLRALEDAVDIRYLTPSRYKEA